MFVLLLAFGLFLAVCPTPDLRVARTPVFVAHTPFHLTHFLLFNFYCTYLFLFFWGDGGGGGSGAVGSMGFFSDRSIASHPFECHSFGSGCFRIAEFLPFHQAILSLRRETPSHESFQLGDYLLLFYFSPPLLTPTQVIWSSHLSYFGKSTLKEIVHSEGTIRVLHIDS